MRRHGAADSAIAGMPDPGAERFGDISPDLGKTLKDIPNTTCILPARQPNTVADNPDADIQLSGHAHPECPECF